MGSPRAGPLPSGARAPRLPARPGRACRGRQGRPRPGGDESRRVRCRLAIRTPVIPLLASRPWTLPSRFASFPYTTLLAAARPPNRATAGGCRTARPYPGPWPPTRSVAPRTGRHPLPLPEAPRSRILRRNATSGRKQEQRRCQTGTATPPPAQRACRRCSVKIVAGRWGYGAARESRQVAEQTSFTARGRCSGE